MEFELNDFLNGLFCRKDIKIKQPINSNTIAEAVNEYLKNKQASPHSMPDDDAVKCALNEYVRYLDKNEYRILTFAANDFKAGANWMRSQCEGMIKQRSAEFGKWLSKNAYFKDDAWYLHKNMSGERYTIEELYEIFNQQER